MPSMIEPSAAGDLIPKEPPTLVGILEGAGFGVRQPVLIVKIPLPLQTTVTWEGIAESLEALLGVAAPVFSSNHRVFHNDFTEHVCAVAVELQQKAGLPVFEKSKVLTRRREGSNQVSVFVAVPYAPRCAKPAFDAVLCAHKVLSHLLTSACNNDSLVAARQQFGKLIKRMQTLRPKGLNPPRFLRAAHQCGIPWDWTVANSYQFGWGMRQCWLDSTILDTTTSMGVAMARNKMACAQILRRAGLPVPDHALADSLEEATRIADRLGYPVVIKPVALDGGVGVAAGLQNPEQLERAWKQTARHTQKIMVEKHQEGEDFRLLVLDGKLIWAVSRIPGGVTGDGERTIGELVESTNRDPRRGNHAEATLRTLTLDDEALDMLRKQGVALDTVLAAGQFIRLRSAANISSGGTPVVVNHQVHPDNRLLAERAVALLNLDIAGVDLLIPDIAVSWQESGAAILEINAQPQLVAASQKHLYRQILEARISHDGRIPVAIFLGGIGSNELALSVGKRLLGNGHAVGVASRQGLWLNGRPIGRKGLSSYEAGKALLAQRDAAVMLLVADDKALLRTGLPVDRFDLLVVSEPEDIDPAESNWIDRALRLAMPHCVGSVICNSPRAGAFLERLRPNASYVAVPVNDILTLEKTACEWMEARIEEENVTLALRHASSNVPESKAEYPP
jgi:cyanophycin synthetase